MVEKSLHDVNKIQDFAPYVAKISAVKADTAVTGNWSNDLLLLMKANKAAGLKTRFATTYLDQPGNLANAGDVALGHYVAQTFNAEAGGAEAERSLLGNPLVMLIDEPTEGLAPKIVTAVGECIKDMHSKGVSIVLVEQKLAIALKVSSRVCVMGHGRIVYQGTPQELASNEQLLAEWLAV